MRKATLGLIVIVLLVGIPSLFPLSWHDLIENSLIDLQFKLRGARPLSDEIVFVYIGAEDAQALGGWPITRDYYGYMTHVLNQLGASVIGFDILFDTPNHHYPEFDNILADFFQSAGNVCLPMAFAELARDENQSSQRSNQVFVGRDPVFPFDQLRKHAAGIGFSNFTASPVVRKAPLVAAYNDVMMLSFGAELARLYLNSPHRKKAAGDTIAVNQFVFPIDRQGQLRLNHFGGLDDATAMSFVEVLKVFERAPDSLDFKDKIVLAAATFSGAPTLKATPLSNALPGALIHATVAENLIHRNFLREAPKPWQLILIILMAMAAWVVSQLNPTGLKIAGGLGMILIYAVIAQIAFNQANLVLPLFYPAIAYLITLSYAGVMRRRGRQSVDESIKQLLQEQIIAKESALEIAQSNLAEVHNLVQQQAADSEQIRQMADGRQKKIFDLEKELRDLRTHIIPEEKSASPQFPEIIHAPGGKIAEVLAMAEKVGAENIAVLILGETGTGKEMIARAIHQSGKRKNAPFVAVNCGALPETLLESELFGHEKGSFTGAQARRRGRFELADQGTIFLDEISETTPAFQARLLRVLQEGAFERLGGEETIKVDVRLIAASNKNLPEEVANGRFRADLFYRLNGFPITLPPLRERREDIPLLARHFLKKHGRDAAASFSDQAMNMLENYQWPGNVRELENAVRRAAILAQSESRQLIQVADLPKEIVEKQSPQQATVVYQTLEEQILEMLRALKFSRSAISQTAKALGNRDRGTITEYFRGICFEILVNADFDVEKAARIIAATNDEETVGKVQSKIDEYLRNLRASDASEALFKGLPKKYHSYLQQVIRHFA